MKRLFCIALCALLLFCSCAFENNSDKPTVVATLFPHYDFARNIAEQHANVSLLLDFGTDAHSFDPTPKDIMQIASADLFIYTGGDMELWAKTLLESADVAKAIERGSLKVLDLSEYVTLLEMHGHHDEIDSHIWTSPENATKMCAAITDALCSLDIANADSYRANFGEYAKELASLEDSLLALKKGDVFFGGSFAFRYMFEAAGLDHHSIYEGCASHAEPSSADIANMVEKIKASGAKYVLYDSPSEQKLAHTVAKECGAEVLHLHAIHNITKAEFDAGENYISLMQKNIETLRKALS